MRYLISAEEQPKVFRPYSITLTVETEEEHIRFHDVIMPQLTQEKLHQFQGDIFDVGRGNIDEAEG